MSTGKTNYLGLHRWEPEDHFLRSEFNENSDKLDAELEVQHRETEIELALVRSEMAQELETLNRKNEIEFALMRSEVNGKADLAHTHTLDSLGAQAAASAVKMEVLRYVGNDLYGEANPTAWTFSFAPKVMITLGYYNGTQAFPGHYSQFSPMMDCASLTTDWKAGNTVLGLVSYDSTYFKKSADGKTIYVYAENGAGGQFNSEGYTYCFLALG